MSRARNQRDESAVRLDLSHESFGALRGALWGKFYDERQHVKEFGLRDLDDYRLRSLRHDSYTYGELRRASLRRSGAKVPRRTRALDFDGHYRPISRFPTLGRACLTCGNECYGPLHDIAHDGPNIVYVCRKTPNSRHWSNATEAPEVLA